MNFVMIFVYSIDRLSVISEAASNDSRSDVDLRPTRQMSSLPTGGMWYLPAAINVEETSARSLSGSQMSKNGAAEVIRGLPLAKRSYTRICLSIQLMVLNGRRFSQTHT